MELERKDFMLGKREISSNMVTINSIKEKSILRERKIQTSISKSSIKKTGTLNFRRNLVVLQKIKLRDQSTI